METEILRAFRADSRTMVRELGFLQERWSPAGIPHAQVHLLLELASGGGLRPSDLAARLRSDPAVISRGLRQLSERGLITSTPDPTDRRQRLLELSPEGQQLLSVIHEAADQQVSTALALLSPGDQQLVVRGMAAYARALVRARRQADLTLRPLQPGDDPLVAAIIRAVMPEFGASGPGFALSDPEVDAMFAAYDRARAGYWVIEDPDGQLLGCGGYAPLEGGSDDVAELRKMYFRPELRGLGMGARLLSLVLQRARQDGYRTCYLETLAHMDRARRLYESFGFVRLDTPMGATGHHGCDVWYARPLEDPQLDAT